MNTDDLERWNREHPVGTRVEVQSMRDPTIWTPGVISDVCRRARVQVDFHGGLTTGLVEIDRIRKVKDEKD